MLVSDGIDQAQSGYDWVGSGHRDAGAETAGRHSIVGRSPAMQSVLRQVRQVARTSATVLICGETGTGKELIAQAVHDLSGRRDRRLVSVNCAAISAGVVESELFGHEKGSFTGAVTTHEGRFEAANGGTLFMDEVGELPLDTQVKLLRVLQEGEFERVGSNEPREVDVRIVAATNRDLNDSVREGRFRADLLYRLNVFPIQMPPLRERMGDLPLLVDHLLTRLSAKLGKPLRGVSRASMVRLQLYPWPGNIRELQNVLERAAILAPGPIVDVDDACLPATSVRTAAEYDQPLDTLENAARSHIMTALDQTNWQISGSKGAAALLDVNPNTLRSRMKKLGIQRVTSAA